MSDIALYNTLRKIPGVSDDEAKEAVTYVASSKNMVTKADMKDMATKADIKDMVTKADIKDMATKADIKHMATKADVERMARITIMWMVVVGVAVIGIVIAAVG